MTPREAPGAVPLDADDTRSSHFGEILRRERTWVIAGTIAVGLFIALGFSEGPALGAAAAGAVLLLTVLVAWLLATTAAQKDFFTAYAAARGLHWHHGRARLPLATPLLRKGDERYAEETFNGRLPGGAEGTLALYTFVDKSTDSKGNTQKTYFEFTVALVDLRGSVSFIKKLYCQQRRGFRILDSAEDIFRKSQRVELESAAVDRRYEIFAGESDDMNLVRQFFEPSFLVWLAESPPEDFAFELEAGKLCCSVRGHKKSAVDLDELCRAAGTVAERLLDEAAE